MTSPPRALWTSLRSSSYAGMLAFVAIVCLALVGMDAHRLWSARVAKLEEARRETANLARSLAQHARDAVQAADTVLLGLRERVEAEGTEGGRLELLHRVMAVQDAALPLARGLFLFDEHGDSVATSASAGPTGLNYTDRPYFQRHRALPDRGPHVSGPFRSRTDGAWIVVLSRRVDRPDGAFAGVVLATMSVEFFRTFYEAFDVGAHGVVTLASMDGTIMARRPHEGRNIGRSLADSEVYRKHIPGADAGSYEVVGGIDGLVRLGSFHRVAEYPLVVLVSRVKREVLARWRARAWMEFGAALVVALTIGFLGWRVSGQIRERQRAEARYRLLADHSSDAIVCTGPDGRFRYLSPSFAAMTGWSREEALGQDPREFIHPDDREDFTAALDRLRAGEGSVVCTYRLVCEDGSLIWVEDRRRAASDRRGEAPEHVGNIRDITARKSLEDRLTAANAELAALSATDGLTGLANRRRFDQALAEEWARSGRDRRPLSLLLLDADHFKAYNDAHGHPAGDEVLKAIAACIRADLRHPVDVAARYGGEEFAVILPGTGPEGAVLVAERIRRAVLARGLPHRAAPSGVVSVSLGAASVASADGQGVASLVELADAALYRAKRLGRNRAEEACCASGAAPKTADAWAGHRAWPVPMGCSDHAMASPRNAEHGPDRSAAPAPPTIGMAAPTS